MATQAIIQYAFVPQRHKPENAPTLTVSDLPLKERPGERVEPGDIHQRASQHWTT